MAPCTGLPLAASLLLLPSAVAATAEPSSAMCPGVLPVHGYGNVSLASARWAAPGVGATPVQVVGGREIQPQPGSRTYFSEQCRPGSHSSSWYTSLELLGKQLTYTVDLSAAECGCTVGLSLLRMYQSREPSECRDYYCDAKGTCGGTCDVVEVQAASRRTWRSSLHRGGHLGGATAGHGSGPTGPSDFDPAAYGPDGACIDTRLPFQVMASFPTDEEGRLARLEVMLSQGRSSPCRLPMRLEANSEELRAPMVALLQGGLTPAIRYEEDPDEVCTVGAPRGRCAAGVSLRGFAVRALEASDAPPCLGGWRPAAACTGTVNWLGSTYGGCIRARSASARPWCSLDEVYQGRHSYCEWCGTRNPHEEVATPAPAKPEATAAAPPASAAAAPGPSPVLERPLGRRSIPASERCAWPVRLERERPADGRERFQWLEQGPGLVALVTSENRFVTASPSGGLAAAATRLPAKGGLFQVGWLESSEILLQTEYGGWLDILPNGTFAGTAPSREVAQRLGLHQWSEGTVDFRAADGRYLVAAAVVCTPRCALEASTRFGKARLAQEVTWEHDASSCQARCAAAKGCAYFTFLETGGSCHLAEESAPLMNAQGAVSGPALCEDLVVRRYAASSEQEADSQVGMVAALGHAVGVVTLAATLAFVFLLALKLRSARVPGLDDARTFSRSDLLRVSLEGDEEAQGRACLATGDGL